MRLVEFQRVDVYPAASYIELALICEYLLVLKQ